MGLPLLSRFLKAKINVFGIDIDQSKIKSLRNGKIYIKSTDPLIAKYFKKNKKNLSTDYKIANKCDVLIICLPTPLKKNSKKPDMSYVFNCARILKKYI